VCSEQTIRRRLEGREKRIGDWKTESERLDTHLSETKGVYKGERDEKLAEYVSLRSRTLYVALDGEQSLATICDEVEATLRRVANAKDIALLPAEDAPRAGDGGGAVKATVQAAIRGVLERAFLEQVTRSTWHEGGFGHLERTSPRSGRGGGRGGFGGKGGSLGGRGNAGGGRGGAGSGEASGSRGGFGGKGGSRQGKGGGEEGKGGSGEGKGGSGGVRGKGGRGSGDSGSRGGAPSGSGKGGNAGGHGKGGGITAGRRGKGGGGGSTGTSAGAGGGGSRADASGSWRC